LGCAPISIAGGASLHLKLIQGDDGLLSLSGCREIRSRNCFATGTRMIVIDRLIQIRQSLHWLPQVFARINVGLFFSISGYNKLFVPTNQAAMLTTMQHACIPFPEFNAVFVAVLEFVFGGLLALGLLTRASALILLAIVGVATFSDGVHKIPVGLGPLDWYDWFLYLPEVLYGLLLFWILFAGAERFGADPVLAKRFPKLRRFI
jgi:putative oxidoreductase